MSDEKVPPVLDLLFNPWHGIDIGADASRRARSGALRQRMTQPARG